MFFMLGCRTGPLDQNAIREIFQGFSFTGETKAKSEERLRPATQPFPNSVESGRYYVFNHERPVDVVQLATRVLPGRT
jgi:hypothetical protein